MKNCDSLSSNEVLSESQIRSFWSRNHKNKKKELKRADMFSRPTNPKFLKFPEIRSRKTVIVKCKYNADIS